MTPNVSIAGVWTTRAREFNPQKKITTDQLDGRFFYRLTHNAESRQKVITTILLDGAAIGEPVHDWLSNDGREDNFFDVPASFRTPGDHDLKFVVYAPVSDAAVAEAGEKIFESDGFVLEYLV